MGTGIGPGIGATWRPDGPVHYRTDSAGTRIGVLPAICKRGLHTLTRTGYEARGHPEDGLVTVGCQVCQAVPDPDYAWSLATSGPPPERVELDDGPYKDIEPMFIQRRDPGVARRPAAGHADTPGASG